MKFISKGSSSARYYIDEAANERSVKFVDGELETDDPEAVEALKALAERGAPIEVVEDEDEKAEPKAEDEKAEPKAEDEKPKRGRRKPKVEPKSGESEQELEE